MQVPEFFRWKYQIVILFWNGGSILGVASTVLRIQSASNICRCSLSISAITIVASHRFSCSRHLCKDRTQRKARIEVPHSEHSLRLIVIELALCINLTLLAVHIQVSTTLLPSATINRWGAYSYGAIINCDPTSCCFKQYPMIPIDLKALI